MNALEEQLNEDALKLFRQFKSGKIQAEYWKKLEVGFWRAYLDNKCDFKLKLSWREFQLLRIRVTEEFDLEHDELNSGYKSISMRVGDAMCWHMIRRNPRGKMWWKYSA